MPLDGADESWATLRGVPSRVGPSVDQFKDALRDTTMNLLAGPHFPVMERLE